MSLLIRILANYLLKKFTKKLKMQLKIKFIRKKYIEKHIK